MRANFSGSKHLRYASQNYRVKFNLQKLTLILHREAIRLDSDDLFNLIANLMYGADVAKYVAGYFLGHPVAWTSGCTEAICLQRTERELPISIRSVSLQCAVFFSVLATCGRLSWLQVIF